MANTQKLVVVWNGAAGLPGVSVFYGPPATDPTGSVKAFFTAVQSLFPAGLTWTIPNSGDTVDVSTGVLTGEWTGTGGGSVSASGSGVYAAGCGMYVQWGTAIIANGRRVKGRTFLAPVSNDKYDNGDLTSAALTTAQNAANTLAATGNVWVWHRPQGGTGGNGCVITSATVPNQVTSLASRRR